MNRIAVFTDASNLWEAQKIKGQYFDFEKLRKYLKEYNRASTLKIFYYTAYPAIGTRDYSLLNRHNFYTYLKKGLGFIVRKKELKRIHVASKEGFFIQEKGNMDVEIAIDAVRHIKMYDTAILFSGDSDFLSLVLYLKSMNKKVIVYSSRNNISEELRFSANKYIDVLSVSEDIWGKKIKSRSYKNNNPLK